MLAVETREIGRRNENATETKFFGFGYALHDSTHWTNLTTETYFTCHTYITFKTCIYIARKNGSNDTEVDGWVVHTDSSSYIEINIFLGQLETNSLFKYGKKHIEATKVETSG